MGEAVRLQHAAIESSYRWSRLGGETSDKDHRMRLQEGCPHLLSPRAIKSPGGPGIEIHCVDLQNQTCAAGLGARITGEEGGRWKYETPLCQAPRVTLYCRRSPQTTNAPPSPSEQRMFAAEAGVRAV